MEILKLVWEFIWGWDWATITGFAGVILTLVVNAKVARFQQERQWAADRRALRQGLLVELQSLSATLRERIKLCDEADPLQGKMLCPKFEVPIYRASLSRLGRITGSEAHTVFTAYDALVTQEQEAVAVLGKPRTGETYIISGSNISLYRKVMAEAILPKIEKALKELRKNQD